MIELGHVLNQTMPFFGSAGSTSQQAHLHEPAVEPPRKNEEIVISEIGQVGTQLDAFSHQSIEDGLYNCIKINDVRPAAASASWV